VSYLKPVAIDADAQAAGEQLAEAIFARRRKPRCPCGAVAGQTVVKVVRLGPTLAIDLHLRCGRCAKALRAATEAIDAASVAPISSSKTKPARRFAGDGVTCDDARQLRRCDSQLGGGGGEVVSLA
jgi:hypothetical protein